MAKNMSKAPALIPSSSLAFLKSLRNNNNRDWFNKHKERFPG